MMNLKLPQFGREKAGLRETREGGRREEDRDRKEEEGDSSFSPLIFCGCRFLSGLRKAESAPYALFKPHQTKSAAWDVHACKAWLRRARGYPTVPHNLCLFFGLT